MLLLQRLPRRQVPRLGGKEVSRHIPPRSTLNDVVDRDSVNAESSGDLAVAQGGAQYADFTNLFRCQLRVATALHICRWRDRFQMVWIHAQAIATQMVNFRAGGDLSLVLPVGPAMNVFDSAVNAELGVSAIGRRSLPHPAAVVVNDVCRLGMVATIAVTGAKTNRLALDVATTWTRFFSQARLLAAAAHAQAGRVRAFVGILSAHSLSLLDRLGGAVPGALQRCPAFVLYQKPTQPCGKSPTVEGAGGAVGAAITEAASAAFG